MLLGLLQKDVAARIGVTASSVLNWEKNRSEPDICFMPKVIEFLEYDPGSNTPLGSLAEQLQAHRTKLGLSQKKVAKLLGIDQSSVAGWETGRHTPNKKSLAVIESFLTLENLDGRKSS